MKRFLSVFTFLLIAFNCISSARAAGTAAPDFKEVYDLVRAHVAGMSDAELNRAAVEGFLSALGSKASLVTTNGAGGSASNSVLVSSSKIFDNDIGYLRINRVGDGLAKEVASAFGKLGGTNKLKGLVLDLRYAEGSDYAAAAATADLFTAKAQPLLNWGNGPVSSHEKKDAIEIPVAVLVNRETSGAAEALAAALRETSSGLILGGRTAGRAMVAREFPLKSGERLRIAAMPVTLGNGSALSAQGLKPDIEVMVSTEEERIYYADAFRVIPKGNFFGGMNLTLTNQPVAAAPTRRARFNEAELVRTRAKGVSEDDFDKTPRLQRTDTEPEITTVNDPALARALDLLKGLAVVRRMRS